MNDLLPNPNEGSLLMEGANHQNPFQDDDVMFPILHPETYALLLTIQH